MMQMTKGFEIPGHLHLRAHGWSPKRCIPHGGHQMSLNIAAGLGLGGNGADLYAEMQKLAARAPPRPPR